MSLETLERILKIQGVAVVIPCLLAFGFFYVLVAQVFLPFQDKQTDRLIEESRAFRAELVEAMKDLHDEIKECVAQKGRE